MKKYVFATLIFLMAAGGTCMAQSDEPSLGDLAKKHRQEEKKLAVKTKVFTNEDVATSTPSAPAVTASASTPAPAATAAAKSTDKAGDTSKAAAPSSAATKDAPEVAQLKQKLSTYKEQQDGWKQSAKKYEDLLANETSDFRRQMYQDALQGDRQNVQSMQDKIDQTQSDLAKAEKAQNH